MGLFMCSESFAFLKGHNGLMTNEQQRKCNDFNEKTAARDTFFPVNMFACAHACVWFPNGGRKGERKRE